LADLLVDVHQVAAEERVELGVLRAREVVAEPPEPVAAFGGAEAFPGHLARGAADVAVGAAEQFPPPAVLGMADPDAEVAVDPRARRDALDRIRRHDLAHRRGPDPRMVRQRPEELAQERDAAVGIMLPGILAVEAHRDGT